MKFELAIPLRRTLLLAAAAQAIALASSSGVADPMPGEIEQSIKGLLNQLISEFRLATPNDLPTVFVELLKLKLKLSLSELGKESQDELSRAVAGISDLLIKNGYAKEVEIAEQAKQKIMFSTILLQNTMVSMGTSKDGTVSVTASTFETARKFLCLWPYC